MLSAPEAWSCGMNFSGVPGAREGVIEPDGGGPGEFFASRHWAFEQGTLVIDDYDHNPLAHLTFADGRFAGQSSAGHAGTLARELTLADGCELKSARPTRVALLKDHRGTATP